MSHRALALASLALAALACADPTAGPTTSSVAPSAARGGNAAGSGPLVYGLSADNELITFSAAQPNKVLQRVVISGLGGERLVGIDFRPSDLTADNVNNVGRLYGVGAAGRIYTIDPTTGAATFVSALVTAAGAPVALVGGSFGVGFNPAADRLRIHSDADQDLRINVDNGVTIVDGTLAYAAGDANAGANPTVVGTAYTNNDADATTGTALYAIDSDRDALVFLAAPNTGQLTTVGALGVDTDAAVGFEIVGTTTVAYAALSESASGKPTLYQIDLATGAASRLGLVAQTKAPLVGIAVAP